MLYLALKENAYIIGNYILLQLLNYARVYFKYKTMRVICRSRLPLRLSRRQSMSSQTVLLRTTLTRTIIIYRPTVYDMNPGFEPFTVLNNFQLKYILALKMLFLVFKEDIHASGHNAYYVWILLRIIH